MTISQMTWAGAWPVAINTRWYPEVWQGTAPQCCEKPYCQHQRHSFSPFSLDTFGKCPNSTPHMPQSLGGDTHPSPQKPHCSHWWYMGQETPRDWMLKAWVFTPLSLVMLSVPTVTLVSIYLLHLHPPTLSFTWDRDPGFWQSRMRTFKKKQNRIITVRTM